ncbi:MAG: aspartate aminotransferase family protein [Bacillota bacterium]|nr:aspartate aminotransferase family protein [Bacillota bacterium]
MDRGPSHALSRLPFEDLVGHLKELLAPSLANDWPNLPVARAEGSLIWGADGRRYIDFVEGFAANNTGHRHPRVIAAVREQLERLVHSAIGVTVYEPVLRLAARLREVTPEGIESFFFGNSGAEAVEGAVKLARYATGRPAVIAFWGGFHGRTFGAMSLTASKAKYRLREEPLLGGVYHSVYPEVYRSPHAGDPERVAEEALRHLRRLFAHEVDPSQVAAIVVEPVQGEGGYVVPPARFLHGLREIADRHGILLVFDEVQTGFGRTGRMFAAQTFGVRPDVLVMAKGIASGFPLSAIGASENLMRGWGSAAHGTTFGGNPVSCAAALATLDVLEEEALPERAASLGPAVLERLRQLRREAPIIGDVRGVGFMIAAEFVDPETGEPDGETAHRVIAEALERGLLLYPAGAGGEVIRFMPALNIPETILEEGLEIFEEAVRSVAGERVALRR